jgi:serine/threonine protein kinase
MISIGDELDGKYIVARKLGSGGFGEVFLAHDEVACRHVAIKVLRTDDRDRGLIWEMQALAALDLQGVVAFYHHFTEGDRLFLVMGIALEAVCKSVFAALPGFRKCRSWSGRWPCARRLEPSMPEG